MSKNKHLQARGPVLRSSQDEKETPSDRHAHTSYPEAPRFLSILPSRYGVVIGRGQGQGLGQGQDEGPFFPEPEPGPALPSVPPRFFSPHFVPPLPKTSTQRFFEYEMYYTETSETEITEASSARPLPRPPQSHR